MKRYLVLCVLSAMLGATAVRFWPRAGSGPLSVGPAASIAAEPGAVGQNAPNEAPAVRTAPPAVAPMDADTSRLTPEEQVNVAVYAKVNRSVVNINTRGVQADRFSLFEVPSKGAGSGSVLDQKGHIL